MFALRSTREILADGFGRQRFAAQMAETQTHTAGDIDLCCRARTMARIWRKSTMSSTAILTPTAPAQRESTNGAAFALDRLEGKVVGFLDNAKPNFSHLVDAIAELLSSQYGVARVIKQRKRAASIPAERSVLDALSADCDLVITGSGD
jgi:hypothetical protein